MSFLFEDTTFTLFSLEHLMPLFFFAIITIVCIFIANRHLNEKQKSILGAGLALIPLIGVCTRMGLLAYLGQFELQEDLPIHLCRFASLIAPVVMFKRNRFWLVVLYFWIIVGTLNANITPDLQQGFPHFEFLIYFALHSGLMVLPFYAVFVYNLDVKLKDAVITFFLTNVFFFSVHVVNLIIGSNYMYTMAKPPVESLIDLLGPWPWYLLTGQGLVIGLMFIAYLPFALKRLSIKKPVLVAEHQNQ